MSMQAPSFLEQPQSQERIDGLSEVLSSLKLEPQDHPVCTRAKILCRRGSTPVAAILEQGATFREDKRVIQVLKDADRELPIIYIAKNTQLRRETAIRRMCIHYYLAQPLEISELKLVLETLVRSTVPASSFERFFTR